MKMLVKFGLLFFMAPLYMFWEARRNRLIKEKVTIKDLPPTFEGKNLLFISDIHKRQLPQRFVNEWKNDVSLIIVGGDLAEKGVPEERVRKNLRLLKQAGEVLFVWGNNDMEERTMITRLLEEEDIISLENDSYQWKIKGDSVGIVGLGNKYGRLDSRVAGIQGDECCRIAVVHDPAAFRSIKEKGNISFGLAGHTHGGQIRIGSFGIGEKGGWKKVGNMPVLISNGYGTTAVPLRLGAPSQVHLLTLSASEES
ncbi:metallophosphoesterase [Alteribacillus iranensis]|uniref:Predicted phosphohydrolase, MPP superfamily n=1 Tax=Alteribacillus iranensis TaxID=930128 RepID=A0A1I1ZND6_9BACI|nr:metallophosphoesterase family protein [Alteribacillus iranensis]SFE33334.1 Predicted phosphohydrolase, MPP superfamily [Alteribacillus iranensis]